MQSYNRVYRISIIEQVVENLTTVGSFPLSVTEGYNFPYNTPTQFTPRQPEAPIATSTVTKAGNSVVITDLSMRASIKSATAAGQSASATITIYNASEETRLSLEKQNAYVVIEAGYDDQFGVIFTGNIISYDTVKSHPDIETTLTCSASDVPIKTARTSISYNPKYQSGTYGDVIRDVVKQMKTGGIAEGVIVTDKSNLPNLPSPDDTPINGGYSFRGYVTQLLDNICEQFDYTWYITLNELYIHPKFYNSFGVKYTLNDYQVKSIKPKQDTANISPTIVRPSGLSITTTLDYRMKVGESIEVTFGQYKGTYKILDVEFQLDYEGQEWDTLLSLEVVN